MILSDSFKGTLSSLEAGQAMKKGMLKTRSYDIDVMAIADGGEGTIACYKQFYKGYDKEVVVHNPYFEKINTTYFIFDDGKTALIESAICIGLPLVEYRKNPEVTTTYGLGEMILDAMSEGVKHIIVGLGGSATNDAGLGMLCALGMTCYNHQHQSFIPTGSTLMAIHHIDADQLKETCKDVQFSVLTDVDAILYGPKGAAYRFASQKGADELMVKRLDKGLIHVALLNQSNDNDAYELHKGSGAAGGLGFAFKAFLNAELIMGVDHMLQHFKSNLRLTNYDLVLTGEGCFDQESLQGKVVSGILNLTCENKVPVIIFCGINQVPKQTWMTSGILDVISVYQQMKPLDEIKKTAAIDLETAVYTYFKGTVKK